MNTTLSMDERARMVVKEMTLEEKITLLHGTGDYVFQVGGSSQSLPLRQNVSLQ
jgi:hypothetical protein